MVAQPNYGLSTDTTLGGNSPSDIISPSEKAIKTYIDAHSGGASTLNELTDVTISLASNGQILQYNGTSSKWTNTALSLTSAQVTNALGYTPYDGATNPNGYTSNVGTVTKVNNTSPDSNGNVSLTIPTTTDSVTSGSAAALTSGGAYTNLVRRLSTSAATGGANQGVYIDANGQSTGRNNVTILDLNAQ